MDTPTRPPHTDNRESPRSLWGSALLFLGPIVGGGGVLALLRTGERDPFYALLMPVGILMWVAGLYLKRTTAGSGDQTHG